MNRKVLRISGIVVLVLIVLEITSCRIYDAVSRPEMDPYLIRRSVAASNGYTISYVISPLPYEQNETLPRILYVHGTPGDALAFESFLRPPIEGLDCISIDRPGFGLTKPRTPVYSLAEQTQALEPLLVNREGQGTILVGHSLGGPIIVDAALRYPDRVGGLVILSGCLDPALEKIAWYQRVLQLPLIPYMVPYFLRNANRELLPLKAELEALQPRLKNLRCPIVIVHAPDDILVPFANVDYMRKEFPAAAVLDVMVLEGKSHWVPWNAEPEVRNAIAKVVQAIKGPASEPGETTP